MPYAQYAFDPHKKFNTQAEPPYEVGERLQFVGHNAEHFKPEAIVGVVTGMEKDRIGGALHGRSKRRPQYWMVHVKADNGREFGARPSQFIRVNAPEEKS